MPAFLKSHFQWNLKLHVFVDNSRFVNSHVCGYDFCLTFNDLRGCSIRFMGFSLLTPSMTLTATFSSSNVSSRHPLVFSCWIFHDPCWGPSFTSTKGSSGHRPALVFEGSGLATQSLSPLELWFALFWTASPSVLRTYWPVMMKSTVFDSACVVKVLVLVTPSSSLQDSVLTWCVSTAGSMETLTQLATGLGTLYNADLCQGYLLTTCWQLLV